MDVTQEDVDAARAKVVAVLQDLRDAVTKFLEAVAPQKASAEQVAALLAKHKGDEDAVLRVMDKQCVPGVSLICFCCCCCCCCCCCFRRRLVVVVVSAAVLLLVVVVAAVVVVVLLLLLLLLILLAALPLPPPVRACA